MTVAGGKRLERFVRERWGREQGGIRALAKELHVAPDRVYAWFRDKAPPDTDQLRDLARLLKATRVEIIAAMDDLPADPSEAMARRVAREEFESLMTREIAAGRWRVLPEDPPGSQPGDAPQ